MLAKTKIREERELKLVNLTTLKFKTYCKRFQMQIIREGAHLTKY